MNDAPDRVCPHGHALDIHCCGCRRSGFFPPETCDCYEPPARQHTWYFYMNGTFCTRCGTQIGSGQPCR